MLCRRGMRRRSLPQPQPQGYRYNPPASKLVDSANINIDYIITLSLLHYGLY